GRFSYGAPQAHPASETIDLADLERKRANWRSYSNEGLLSLGLAWRGAFNEPKSMVPNDAARREFAAARKLGLPISIHVSNARARAGQIAALAKIEGARSMGVDERVGSLKAGKRADLIMVNTREVNLGVFSEPAHMLVEAAQPSNVDTVMVDGRILKRRGRLTAVDVEQVVSE